VLICSETLEGLDLRSVDNPAPDKACGNALIFNEKTIRVGNIEADEDFRLLSKEVKKLEQIINNFI